MDRPVRGHWIVGHCFHCVTRKHWGQRNGVTVSVCWKMKTGDRGEISISSMEFISCQLHLSVVPNVSQSTLINFPTLSLTVESLDSERKKYFIACNHICFINCAVHTNKTNKVSSAPVVGCVWSKLMIHSCVFDDFRKHLAVTCWCT